MFLRLITSASGLAAGLGAKAVLGADSPNHADLDLNQARVIEITAERYKFTPNRIALKLGEPVILKFTTLDLPMGFNAPTLGIRTNILPDIPAQLQLTPQKKGTHRFSCDIACGTGHKDMQGVIVVT
ncbi:MAG TPA: cupredoxin domain-containing protein [Burkholderiaceae bacterium]